MAFWQSPHGPLGSGPPRAGYSQRRKRKEKGERAALIFLPRPVWEPSPPLTIQQLRVIMLSQCILKGRLLYSLPLPPGFAHPLKYLV